MDEFPLRGEVEVDGRRADSCTCCYRANRKGLNATAFEELSGDVEKLISEQTTLALGSADSGTCHRCAFVRG